MTLSSYRKISTIALKVCEKCTKLMKTQRKIIAQFPHFYQTSSVMQKVTHNIKLKLEKFQIPHHDEFQFFLLLNRLSDVKLKCFHRSYDNPQIRLFINLPSISALSQ